MSKGDIQTAGPSGLLDFNQNKDVKPGLHAHHFNPEIMYLLHGLIEKHHQPSDEKDITAHKSADDGYPNRG